VFRAFAATALITVSSITLAATTPTSSPSQSKMTGRAAKDGDALVSAVPWSEKVTVTIAGDGKAQSCRYESSLKPDGGKDCDVAMSAGAMASASGEKGEYTRITFERRFSPVTPESAALQVGDTLLGRQVLALAIDPKGLVKACQIIASSGAMTPDYGCTEATAEHFQAKAGASPKSPNEQGYMTILVYGHSEHIV